MSIETKTFFKIFFFLVVVGIFISLLPGSTATMPSTMNLTLNVTALGEPPVACSSWVPFWCGAVAWTDAVLNFVWSTLSFLWQGLLFLTELVVFFTGISLVFNSTLLPSPLNFIVAVGIALGWLFLALDVASRVVGVIWGR